MSALDGGKWKLMPRPLYPSERAYTAHLTGGCVGLRASLVALVKIKSFDITGN
jgi:hypothetical protein